MVEFLQVSVLLLAVALSLTGIGLQDSKLVSVFRRFAAKQWLVILGVAVTAFLGSVVVSRILHEPVPRVHDEFSYVLMSNTFASGHVSAPTPPLPEFFETFHVLVHPVYVSKYFPAQGVLLAIGEKLTGRPAFGVWISSALACAATCWMLQTWLGPTWGMFGGLLMLLQYGIYSYWSQSFWGGMVPALGGALAFGAVHRLLEHLSWQNAIWLALGAVILFNARPLEGALAMLPVSGLFVWKMWRDRRWKLRAFWIGVVMPAGAVLLVGAAAACLYNRAITGSPWKPPYMLHEEQYQESPPFIFSPPRPRINYSSETLRAGFEDQENELWRMQRDPGGLMRGIAKKLSIWWFFYCGVLLTLPLILPGILQRGRIRYFQIVVAVGVIVLAAIPNRNSVPLRTMIDLLALTQILLLWFVFNTFWQRVALVTCTLLVFETFIVKWSFPHYSAPAASLVLFLQVSGLRRLWHLQTQHQAALATASRVERRRAARRRTQVVSLGLRWRGFVTLLPIVCLISTGVRIEARLYGWSEVIHGPSRYALPMRDWSLRRAQLEEWLEQQPGPQLVFVRYYPYHNVNYEWVWNKPDIVHARVIWARDLGAEHNRLLLREFPDRTVWSIHADAPDAVLMAYSEAMARAPEPYQPPTEAGAAQVSKDADQ